MLIICDISWLEKEVSKMLLTTPVKNKVKTSKKFRLKEVIITAMPSRITTVQARGVRRRRA